MQAGAAALFEALNSFFSTDRCLRTVNAPSANPVRVCGDTPTAVRSADRDHPVVADPMVVGYRPSNYPDGLDGDCPVLFPARVRRDGPFPPFVQRYVRVQADNLEYRHLLYIVGAISAAHTIEYAGTITGLDQNGTPVFTCRRLVLRLGAAAGCEEARRPLQISTVAARWAVQLTSVRVSCATRAPTCGCGGAGCLSH